MGSSSSSSTSKTTYGNTTTSNPYFNSKTTNKGTATNFVKNNAFDKINTFVNQNVGNVLEEYLNPTLNSVTNQSKMNSYINALNENSAKSLENNIINPLSERNMIRSSQATDLYNNLAKTNTNSIANYANELLSTSQSDTASVLKTLLLAYISGYDALSDTQKQSLKASQGNSVKNQSTSSSNFDLSDITNLAATLALSSI